MPDVTRIIEAIQRGEPKAAEELLPLVYDELRRLAASKMASELPGQTLQPTALVHEAWLRLTGSEHRWNGRTHFFATAAEAMRRILVDNARRKRPRRHGGQMARVDVDDCSHGLLSCGSVMILGCCEGYKRGGKACNFRRDNPERSARAPG